MERKNWTPSWDYPMATWDAVEYYTDDDERRCVKCGEVIPLGEEIEYDGYVYCDYCIVDKIRDTFTEENALKVGARHKRKIEINGLLEAAFTEEEIESILMRELKNSTSDMAETIKDCIEVRMLWKDWIDELWHIEMEERAKK